MTGKHTMKIGKATAPRSAICTSNEDTIVVRGHDLSRDLIGQVNFADYFFLLLTGKKPDAAPARCSTPRWWPSPNTAWCPACRRRA
jgi:citrate synthase